MISELDAVRIREPIAGPTSEQLDALEVFAEIESTNTYLMDEPAPMPGRFRVALAENQTAGRGRMDRQWHSPASSGVCLSMAYTFQRRPKFLSCVTLAIGVGVAEALQKTGVRGVGLKWPNDLVLQDGKLGGILTEVKSAAAKNVTIVTGVGINVDLGNNPTARELSTRLGSVIDLASCLPELPSRSMLSTTLIQAIFNALAEFDANGFSSAGADWERYDWLRGQNICVDIADRQVSGVCQGIDTDGALLLQTDNDLQRITSGSISRVGHAGQTN